MTRKELMPYLGKSVTIDFELDGLASGVLVAAGNNNPLNTDFRLNSKDGSVRYFDASAVKGVRWVYGEDLAELSDKLDADNSIHILTKEQQEAEDRAAEISMLQAKIDKWDEHLNYCIANGLSIPVEWVSERNGAIFRLRQVSEQ